MQIFIVIIHILVCILLVLIVLLQRGKGASMGAAFGGSSQTIFGSSGPGTFLGKITTVVALVFMMTSLYLAYFSASKGRSVMDSAPTAAEQTAPQQQPQPQVPQQQAPQQNAPAADAK